MAEPDQMETEEAPEAPEEQVQKDEEQVDEPVKEDEGEAKEETGETDEVSKEEEPPKPKDKFDAIFDSKPSEEDKPSEDKDEGDEDKEDEDKEDKPKEDTFDKMFPEETKTEGNDSDTEPKKESTEESEDKKDSFDNMLDGKSDVDKTENDSAEPKDENETEKSEETDSKPATMIAGDLEESDEKEERTKRATRNNVTAMENEALINSPKNFLEENISEAFKTLDVYLKSLEPERTRTIESIKVGMTVDMATSITRKLRKLYAVTQKNMDLLDRAIVESFVESFPTESTRIHMDRVESPAPRSRARNARNAKKGGKNSGKVKIKPKKKKPVKKGKNIKMNGAPVYEEYVVPSLTGKKKRKKYAESDVECIDVSEEESDAEYYQPKKKSRPGPASSKKGKKAGPKSKTRY